MKERKFVKLRVDMYGDTKFKIIDTMEERDLIHYIWTRLLTLAGKVNLEGKLYMSKSIPYSIETLAIEFNRGVSKIELALNVFKDLEMIELSKDNVYRVKNFAKHQNIKVKEKVEKLDDKEAFNDKEEFKDNEIISNNLNLQDCKSEFNYEKNLMDSEDMTESEVYQETGTISKEHEKNVLNIELKGQEYKPKETKTISEKEAYKNNDYILNKKSNIEACTKISTRLKENKKEIIENNYEKHNKTDANTKVENYNIEVKAANEDNIVNIKNKASKSKLLNNHNIGKKEKSQGINLNMNLLSNEENNKKKKSKKPKKKSEDIEELFFEEDRYDDIVKPTEWSDESILNGNVVKIFNLG
ncbi:replisome organizer [Clostridium botulinum]|uniref:phage replisome organizer N-terminal domain-containing protein n=2 Tax=Clostridium botulinum TaxID=1491 RepID=UPI000174EA5B|nr:phage replisome organizer N-terminal domain-containing protein [Clostridium botulinum]ACD52812.1 N- phage replisome organiser [Clostridium botulinum E3 str. Alaska E43]AJF29855.1 replisome organizer [Clostridium botulinum]AJF32916.1 replisome organizer [Clostridium botulinum]MBY6788971.1 phage replisome organizer N-terminal domain-containing protein [Clostridium botulinum]MBY6816725.1 phage replisome organizer N-terminal domain-containing protein [Clostridium botulinum]